MAWWLLPEPCGTGRAGAPRYWVSVEPVRPAGACLALWPWVALGPAGPIGLLQIGQKRELRCCCQTRSQKVRVSGFIPESEWKTTTVCCLQPR